LVLFRRKVLRGNLGSLQKEGVEREPWFSSEGRC